MSATIKDVAKFAGVSVATVSRVIHKNGYVSKETEQKVMKAIQELQYQPTTKAINSTQSSQTKEIALVLPDITNPFFSELARAIEEVCWEHGYAVFFCNSEHHYMKEKRYIEFITKKGTSGALFATNNLSQNEYDQLTDAGIPIVVLDRFMNNPLCSTVRCNNYKGAKLAVQHLKDVGCKKIGHIYGPQEVTTGNERMRGYIDAVKNESWYTSTLMAPGFFHIEGGRQAVDVLLSSHPDMDGIFAGNDLMALGVLKELKRRGIQVPKDIAVCGFDGINLTEIAEPELTTIAQPIYEMGKVAAEMLIKQINDYSLRLDPQIVEMEVQLIVRDSTRK